MVKKILRLKIKRWLKARTIIKRVVYFILYLLTAFAPRPKGYVILLYHRLLTEGDEHSLIYSEIFIKVSDFFKQMQSLQKIGKFVTLSGLVNRIQNKIAPDQLYFALTFDDGYADNYELGFSVTQRFNIRPTIFVCPKFIYIGAPLPYWDELLYLVENTRKDFIFVYNQQVYKFKLKTRQDKRSFIFTVFAWDYQKSEITKRLMASLRKQVSIPPRQNNEFFRWQLLREAVENGWEVGSHTFSHQVLFHLADKGKFEIEESKKMIEQELKRPISFFSYPLGGGYAVTADTKQLVRAAGYAAALTNDAGINDQNTDIYQLKRIPIVGGDHSRIIKTKIFFAPWLEKIARLIK